MYKSLKVVDARSAQTPGEVFEATRDHLKMAFNGTGRTILSLATVLDPSVHIYNSQLLQYAGYEQHEKQLGYRNNNQLTQLALSLGWQPPQGVPTQFDLLPLIVRIGNQPPKWFTMPEEHEGKRVFQRVKLQHPTHGWLGGRSEADALEWYSTPALANWGLAVDGQRYKLPFSGHYAVEEIIPDLTMSDRMDVSPVLARQVFGVEHENQLPRSLKSTWKSEVRAVINTAVQYSFDKAGVRILDTQRMSGQFCDFMDRYEAEQGELPPVNYAYVRDGFDVWGSDIYHRFAHPIDIPPKPYLAALVRPSDL
jgi:nitric-oxide synthase